MNAKTPLIWLVIGDKPGDNAQIEILAETLGFPYEIKRVIPKPEYVFGKPRYTISLSHLDCTKSSKLEPPWPNLVFTIGRRPSMAALWIKQQSPKCRIVLLGRPRRWLEKFDLIISPIQFLVPSRPNVMQINMPLFKLNRKEIIAAGDSWSPRFNKRAKPIIAIMLGGPTRPFYMNQEVIKGLIKTASTLADKTAGSIYISTSRRTPPNIIKFLEKNAPKSALLYRWGDPGDDNPYKALLDQAECFIVTGDSISMMVEAAIMGKKLIIYPLPKRWWGSMWLKIGKWLHPKRRNQNTFSPAEKIGNIFYRIGLTGYPRDLTKVHQYLIENGLACKPGDNFPAVIKTIPDELTPIISHIRQLITDR